jgi:acetyl esterase/lipase
MDSTTSNKPAADEAPVLPPLVQSDGSLRVAARTYAIPDSFSPEARQAFVDYFARGGDPAFSGDVANIRRIYDTEWAGPVLAQWEARFPVETERTELAGIAVDIVAPPGGPLASHRRKVLVSLHGGAFAIGNGGIGGRLEALPMAALGGYQVIAVDYRQAPEVSFPAATDDVESVYRALLARHEPEDIGIYGSSAGGMLTAQVVARLQQVGLPRPGAIAIMAAGATRRGGGDSSFWMLGLTGGIVRIPAEMPRIPSYFTPEDMADPMAWPAEDVGILSKFPPTLVLSSSRDALLSNALDTHARLREVNVESSLYVREGFGHGYFTQAADLPEVIATWKEVVKHFDKYLGLRRAP